MPNRQQRRHPPKARVSATRVPRSADDEQLARLAREAGVDKAQIEEMLAARRDEPFGYVSGWREFLPTGGVWRIWSDMASNQRQMVIRYRINEPPLKGEIELCPAPWLSETVPPPV